MNNKSKKHVSSAAICLKKSRKIISVLAVVLMLSTIASSVVGAQSIASNELQTSSVNKNLNLQTIRQRLSALREKIKSTIEQLSQIKNKNSDDTKNVNTNSDYSERPKVLAIYSAALSFTRVIRFLQRNASLFFYTNYSGTETKTPIKLLKSVDIDVSGDGEPDINVDLSLYPDIEGSLIKRTFNFSINFKYTIKRLSAFPDKYAHFEAYSEVYLPGILFKKQSGDRIRFGYESPEGEEVPSECKVTYKYMPHILSLKNGPEHKAEINPGSSIGNSKIILLLSYTNFNGDEVVSELKSRTIYNPAIKSEISISGEGIMGGSIFHFTRKNSHPSDIDMYCSFEKNGTSINGYVKDLPEKVTFTIDFGKEGFIEFNTHDQAPSEIGLCDDIYNPVNKVYFTNLPTAAIIHWTRDLIKKYVNVSFYTKSPGITLKGHLEMANSTVDVSVASKLNLDCYMSIDLAKGYFAFERNAIDISFSLSYVAENKSIELSANLSSSYEKPFEIFFDKLFDGDAKFVFSGSTFELTDVNVKLYSATKGNFTLKIDEFKKTKAGSLITEFDSYKEEHVVTVNCTIDIVNGIELRGFVIGYKDFLYPVGDIVEEFDAHHFFSFTLREFAVDIWMNDSRSEGYISISGGLNVIFDSSYRNASDVLVCTIQGAIMFDTEDSVFNISWYTMDGNRTYIINGTAVASISGFELWVKDKMDISIPELTGNFNINTREKEGYIRLYLDNGSALLNINKDINLNDLFNLTLRAELDVDFDIGLNGYVELAWNQTGITSIAGYADGYFVGEIRLNNLFFNYVNSASNVSISADQILIVGDFAFSLDLNVKELSFDADEASLDITNFLMQQYKFAQENETEPPTFDPAQAPNLTIDFSSLHLSVAGFIGLDKNKFQIDADGEIGLTDFHMNNTDTQKDIRMTFATDLSLAGILTFNITKNESLDLQLDSGVVEVSNFYFNLNADSFIASITSLKLGGSFELNVTKDDTQKLDVTASGKGFVNITDLSVYASILEMDLGLLDVELDDVHGSVIDLLFNLSDIKNTTVKSVAVNGAISRFLIQDLALKVNYQLLLNLTGFSMNFSGTGAFSVAYADNELNIDGSINGPGLIEIGVLNINNKSVLIENFAISGPTTFHVYVFADFTNMISDLIPAEFSVVIGCTSDWSFDNLSVAGIIIISDLDGTGDLSIGAETSDGPSGLDLVVAMDGRWDWEQLYLFRLPFKVGYFEGNVVLNVDVSIILGVLMIALYGDPVGGLMFMSNSGVSIAADEHTELDILGWGNIVTIGPVTLEEGAYSMYWDILSGEGEGYLAIDTDWNLITYFTLTIANLLQITRGLRAENFNISWDFDAGLFNIINIDGNIDLERDLEILIFADGEWRVLVAMGAPVADFTWAPSQPCINQAIQFDGSDSYYSYPITRYDWKWSASDSWHNNLGVNPTHTYTQEGDHQVSLRVWHYLKQDISTKTVSVGETPFIIDIIYDGDHLFEFTEFTVHVDDSDTQLPVAGATVKYYSYDDSGNPTLRATNTTNSQGNAGFTAIEVPANDADKQITCNAHVEKDGESADSDYFIVWESLTDIHGRILDIVTHECLSGVLITAEPGGYSCYTPVNPISPFHLYVPAGTYTITASKAGFFGKTLIENLVIPDEMIHFNLGDCYLGSTSYGGLRGTVYDNVTKERLWGVTVTVGGLVSTTGFPSGVFPQSPYPYPSFMLSSGTYTVNFTRSDYYNYIQTVQITAGEVLDISVYMQPVWTSPTGYNDPGNEWDNEQNAYDDSISTFAKCIKHGFYTWQWTNFIELTLSSATTCDKIRFYAWYDASWCNKADIDIFYGGAWHDLYEGTYADKQWVEKPFSQQQVTKARIRFNLYTLPIADVYSELYEFDFHKI